MLKVKLIAHTPQPEKVVAAAAAVLFQRRGRQPAGRPDARKTAAPLCKSWQALGTKSPTEHASFTFAIEGVSRSLLAQITRHRIASYSVQSQRYVNLHQFRYVTPPEIAGDEDALAAFRAAMDAQAQQYQQLARALAGATGRLFWPKGTMKKTAARLAEKRPLKTRAFVAQRLRNQNDCHHERPQPEQLFSATAAASAPSGRYAPWQTRCCARCAPWRPACLPKAGRAAWRARAPRAP